MEKRKAIIPADFDHISHHHLRDLFKIKTVKQIEKQKASQKSSILTKLKEMVQSQKNAITNANDFKIRPKEEKQKLDLYKIFSMKQS